MIDFVLVYHMRGSKWTEQAFEGEEKIPDQHGRWQADSKIALL